MKAKKAQRYLSWLLPGQPAPTMVLMNFCGKPLQENLGYVHCIYCNIYISHFLTVLCFPHKISFRQRPRGIWKFAIIISQYSVIQCANIWSFHTVIQDSKNNCFPMSQLLSVPLLLLLLKGKKERTITKYSIYRIHNTKHRGSTDGQKEGHYFCSAYKTHILNTLSVGNKIKVMCWAPQSSYKPPRQQHKHRCA